MTLPASAWPAVLIVPALNRSGLDRGLAAGPSAIVLTCEPPCDADTLRGAAEAVRAAPGRPALLVRIPARAASGATLALALMAGPDALALAAADLPSVQACAARLAVWEAERSLPDGGIGLMAEVDARAALGQGWRDAGPRLRALGWQQADWAADCGGDGPGLPGSAGDIGRTLVRLAAAAAGVPALDTVASPGRLAAECGAARSLGFAGKMAGTAGEIAAIRAVFAA